MIRNLCLALVVVALPLAARAQPVSPYAGMSLGEMISDGSERVEEMVAAVDDVRTMRADAEESEDPSSYQRLNNFFTQMNARALVAEEALATLRGLRGSASKGHKQGRDEDRALAEHNYGIILAAHTSVMALYRQAQAVLGGNLTEGDGTTVTGGSSGLPGYDVTDRGETTTPDSSRDLRDNSEFQGRTPSTATVDGT